MKSEYSIECNAKMTIVRTYLCNVQLLQVCKTIEFCLMKKTKHSEHIEKVE
jgi:hypothetical protein